MKATANGVGNLNPQTGSGTKLMKLSSYVLALRPWSLSASLMPTLLGAALAYKTTSEFGWSTFLLTILTVVSTHGAGNLVNTYFDYIKGIDGRRSDDRTLVDHLLSQEEVVNFGAFLYTVGCMGFLTLWYLSPQSAGVHLALVYFGGLSSSFLYTGGIGLKYIALGDVLILIIFGPLSVLFAFMAQAGRVEWSCIYYAVPLALNTEAILHSNNTRDLESDRAANIVTIAILVGRTASHILYAFLLFTPYIMFVVASLRYSLWFLLPLITLPAAFTIEKEFRCHETIQNVPRKTANLHLYFGCLYVIAVGAIQNLPFIQ